MKNQALFSSKGISKKIKFRLLQFFFGALRVNIGEHNAFLEIGSDEYALTRLCMFACKFLDVLFQYKTYVHNTISTNLVSWKHFEHSYNRTTMARTPLGTRKYVRDDSVEDTQYTIFNIKKKFTINYPKYAAMGFCPRDSRTSSKQPW